MASATRQCSTLRWSPGWRLVMWWVGAHVAGGIVGGVLAVLVLGCGIMGLGVLALATRGIVDRILVYGIWFLIMSGILGGLIAAILGNFQWWVLQRYISNPFQRSWLRVTIIGGSGGALLFATSVLLTTLMGAGNGPVAFIETMTARSFPTATDELIILINAVIWLASSLLLSAAQWTVLRYYVQGRATWIGASIVGWSLAGYSAAFAMMKLLQISFPPYTSSTVFLLVDGLLLLVVTILPMIIASIVTGLALLRLLRPLPH